MWLGTKSRIRRRPRSLQARAEPGERRVAAEVLVDPVVPDGEAGAADVFLAEVGEDAAVLGEPLGIRSRDAPGRLARLPHAEEPDEVEPVRGQPVELGVGDVVERRLSAQRGRELREPDPRVDLEERGIPRRGHGMPGLSRRATCSRTSGPGASPWWSSARPRPSRARRGRGGVRRGPSSPSGGWPRGRRRCRRGSTRRRGSGRASAGRPGTSPCRRRPGGGPLASRRKMAERRRADLLGHLEEGHPVPGAGRALDLEVVAVEAVEVQEPADRAAR